MKSLREIDHVIRKAYQPCLTENGRISAKWRSKVVESSENRKKYTIVLPPPNITGSLHLGHGLTVAIQDSLIRWHKKRGMSTLWIPGCDHASIATQVAVEKHLLNARNIRRLDLSREEFNSHVMHWKKCRESEIRVQLDKMGSLLAWEKYRFTMDEQYSNAVTEAFCRLYEKGTIYRKLSFVNWCPTLKSTVSDIEVDSVEIDGPTELKLPNHFEKVTFGKMYTVRYKLENGNFVKVSTTRPETILGDVALAVHPNDERFRSLIGTYALHPFFPERKLRIVCNEGVDPEFGTGIVKVTPAHDQLDYEIWLKADLGKDQIINVFDESAHVKPGFGIFSGLSRYTARNKVVSTLESLDQLENVVGHKQILPVCSRSGDVIEPRLKYQWFVTCKDQLVTRAIEVANNGELYFVPDFYKNVWLHWLSNIKDWCISRQLWWGHRIPAYRSKSGKSSVGEDHNWVVARTKAEAVTMLGSADVEQDEDVLDTWFSSGLYPLAALGWPSTTEDLENRYPISIMETGADILFFWVARMVMLCSELAPNLSHLPFNTVLLHGMVRDASGKKMSKSLGNVIDPLDVINGATLKQLQSRYLGANDSQLRSAQSKLYPKGIPECGADGMRMALLLYDTHSTEMNIDVYHLAACRRFGNKLWQAVRFILMHKTEGYRFKAISSESELESYGEVHTMDKWILNRMNIMKDSCHKAFSSTSTNIPNFSDLSKKHITLAPLRINAAATAVRNFIHHDICDIYIEYVKQDLKTDSSERSVLVHDILYTVILDALNYLHPFMPFITEELFEIVRNEIGLPPIDSILDELLVEPSETPNPLHCPSIDEALGGVSAARSIISSCLNGINQQKTKEKLPKPIFSVSIDSSDTEEIRTFTEAITRLLPNVKLIKEERCHDMSRLPLLLSEKISVYIDKQYCKLLLDELKRRSVKTENSKYQDGSLSEPSSTAKLQHMWLDILEKENR